MTIEEQLGQWWPLLSHVFNEPWMQKLGRRVGAVKNDLAPSLENVFRAFRECPPDSVRVVIILQDPYINGEADGLAMSSYGKMTPSLEVVFEEINRTHECKRTQTYLDDWAHQGVLLLNACLTTVLGKSRAHQGWGWELFIQEVLHALRTFEQPIVFMLWGKDAQGVMNTFKPRRDYTWSRFPWKILKTHHPQAQNYNAANRFVGCDHFTEANLHLFQHDSWPIWWPDPKYLADENNYKRYLESLIKRTPHVTAYFTEVLRRNAAIPNRSQPDNQRLGPDYLEDLPF